MFLICFTDKAVRFAELIGRHFDPLAHGNLKPKRSSDPVLIHLTCNPNIWSVGLQVGMRWSLDTNGDVIKTPVPCYPWREYQYSPQAKKSRLRS
ncbi:hypothetical protein ACPV30_18305 [Photobacterium damselae]|uniref:hypothetical protein n=1 Tax=Photobacterium damselae TaxID=38293 RepID=UPI004069082E